MRLKRFDNNHYVFKPSTGARVEHQLLNSVEENKSFYTERQFERSKMARDLYHAIGTPSVSDFKKATKLRMNVISDSVTTEDVKIAEKFFGPDLVR